MTEINTVLVKVEYDLSQTDIGYFALFSIRKDGMIRVLYWMMAFFAFIFAPLDILLIILFGNLKADWFTLLTDLSFLLFYAGYLIYLRYFTQRKKYDPKINKNIPHETFLFYQDHMVNTTQSNEEKSETVYQYPGLVEVYETKHYFYLFESKISSFVVPKRSITLGTADALRSLLKSQFGKKYKKK